MLVFLTALSTASPSPALQNGSLDEEDRFGAVVQIRTYSGSACSATKIAPNRLLTAAHCVLDMASGAPLSGFGVGELFLVSNAASIEPHADLRAVTVAGLEVAPAFTAGMERLLAYKRDRVASITKRFPDSMLSIRATALRARHHFTARYPDVAVVQLSGELHGIPAAKVAMTGLRRGDQVVLVGYGCDQVPAAGGHGGGARRRWGAANVLRVEGVNFYTAATQASAAAPSLCSGDSGGPALRGGQVTGVNVVVYDASPTAGARSNMAANLRHLRAWSALQTAPFSGDSSAPPAPAPGRSAPRARP